jgi:hypothetical protein
MGHSHILREQRFADGVHYINTGCWLPPFDGPHTDPAEPCNCKMAHVVVQGSAHSAELRIFCQATRTVRVSDVKEGRAVAATQEHEQIAGPAGGLVP